jgi:hypothetical protein
MTVLVLVDDCVDGRPDAVDVTVLMTMLMTVLMTG